MQYYTERHGMRRESKKTYEISTNEYAILFDCCDKYHINLAYKFPDACSDGRGICGLDYEKFWRDLSYEIPNLYRKDGRPDIPTIHRNIFESENTTDEFDQYALLDYIEYIAYYCYDYTKGDYHSYFGHYHYTYNNKTRESFSAFRQEINDIFEKTGLLYKLSESGEIERVIENAILNEQIVQLANKTTEVGLKNLLEESISLFKRPNPEDIRNATEKIWDAFERLKSYYSTMDKKSSAQKIVSEVSNGQADIENLISDEFLMLTKIGNSYRIRHHETDKLEITDIKHYEYFFNRCLSLISLALQYLY